jgi:hypothetical protein
MKAREELLKKLKAQIPASDGRIPPYSCGYLAWICSVLVAHVMPGERASGGEPEIIFNGMEATPGNSKQPCSNTMVMLHLEQTNRKL